MDEVLRYGGARLEAFCKAALEALSVSPQHADIVAGCLISANYQGVDTHGVARLPTYMRRLAQGAIDPRAKPAKLGGTGAVAIIDGGNALGPVAALAGMDEAISLAGQHGIGYVAVRNSNHFSYAAHYCEQAAAHGLIGICSSSGEPTVAPWGGTQAFFTNSPLAVAAPTGTDPIVVDLATSVSSRGSIMLAKLLDQQIPMGWAQDKTGRPTTDPAAALEGSVLPLGGAKGYALIVALEVLNSVLSGGRMAPHIGSQADQNGAAAGVSHFFIAIDPAALMPYDQYLERIDSLAAALKDAPQADLDAPIRLPGERRRLTAADRKQNGIPIPTGVLNELKAAVEKYSPSCKEIL